jgi:hypothetical protein
VCRIGNISGQSSRCHAKGVCVELTALETLAHDVDDPVERDLVAIAQRSFRHDEIIELKSLTFANADPELEWRCVLRSED